MQQPTYLVFVLHVLTSHIRTPTHLPHITLPPLRLLASCTHVVLTSRHCFESVLHIHRPHAHVPRTHTTVYACQLPSVCVDPVCLHPDAHISPPSHHFGHCAAFASRCTCASVVLAPVVVHLRSQCDAQQLSSCLLCPVLHGCTALSLAHFARLHLHSRHCAVLPDGQRTRFRNWQST